MPSRLVARLPRSHAESTPYPDVTPIARQWASGRPRYGPAGLVKLIQVAHSALCEGSWPGFWLLGGTWGVGSLSTTTRPKLWNAAVINSPVAGYRSSKSGQLAALTPAVSTTSVVQGFTNMTCDEVAGLPRCERMSRWRCMDPSFLYIPIELRHRIYIGDSVTGEWKCASPTSGSRLQCTGGRTRRTNGIWPRPWHP